MSRRVSWRGGVDCDRNYRGESINVVCVISISGRVILLGVGVGEVIRVVIFPVWLLCTNGAAARHPRARARVLVVERPRPIAPFLSAVFVARGKPSRRPIGARSGGRSRAIRGERHPAHTWYGDTDVPLLVAGASVDGGVTTTSCGGYTDNPIL